MEIWKNTWRQIREGIRKMRLCSIASGSSGNCIYVGSEEAHVLVDVGISGKSIEKGLNSWNLQEKILMDLITHEHSDHIKGLGVIARKYQIPVYTTDGTVDALSQMNLGKMPEGIFHEIGKMNLLRLMI